MEGKPPGNDTNHGLPTAQLPKLSLVEVLVTQPVTRFGWWSKFTSDERKTVDPRVILDYVNLGLSVLNNGFAVVEHVLTLVLPFI